MVFIYHLACNNVYGQMAVKEEVYMKGITLGMHSKDYDFDYRDLIEEIEQTGAEWIGLTVKFIQDSVHSDSIQIPIDDSKFWEQLISTIRASRGLGLKVFLSPIMQIKNPEADDWRGNISPINRQKWFDHYTSIIDKLAKISESENVAMLSIGSELTSLQIDDSFWSDLIARVRNVYSEKLTYSANWDALDERSFFNQLDILGVSAYFQLSNYTNPSQRTLNKSWQKIRLELLDIMKERDMPFFFSELGYRSMNGSNKKPWDHQSHNSRIDLEEQYDCYAAFTLTWKDDLNHKGVFFYDWFGQGGYYDKSYTPRGKPALELIEQFFALKAKETDGTH